MFALTLALAIAAEGILHAQQAPAGQVQPQPSNEAIWQQFLEWLPSAPPVDSPRILLGQYRSRLIANGASTTEADRQMGIIRRTMGERSDGQRLIFNNVYANSTPGFVTQPNALLVATVEGRKPGRALDVGMGQGRNAVFLALKGWDVTGFDISDEGLAVARKNAERAGVKLNAIRETDEAFNYGSDQWDMIVFMYEPFPVTSAAYVERLRTSMKPGGIIVIESFGEEAQTPNRPAAAIDPGQLLAAFIKNFRVVHFEDTVTMADWDVQKKTRLVRMVAEKRQ
jgi:2-polyprenyl-3-methyl-5-hydroxy-6-metoxy-1,4-benzoquinol methylase